MDYIAVCQAWVTSAAGTVTCDGTLSVVAVDDLLTKFSLDQLDLTLIGQAFGAGFILVASFEVVSLSIRQVLKTIKSG